MGWIIFVIGILGWHIGMYGMFKKAGIAPWKALVPFYNTWLIVEKCSIRKYWFWLQLIPIAGQFITIWITIIWIMHFGRVNVLHHAAVTFLPFIYFPYMGFSNKEQWKGTIAFEKYKKPNSREWIDAAVFAIVAATIIRTFFFEAYVIPTGSMERTLLVNDFLFVNKIAYGQRIPQTPLSIPFVHNTMPFAPTTPCYIKQVQIPYYRLKGYSDINRNDVVVFNFPAGDTIINLPDYGSKQPYYDILRTRYNGNRDALMAEFPILVHPMDKTDNYIKRCVAIPGDKLQVKDGVLFINDKKATVPPAAQTEYRVETNGTPFAREFLENEMGFDFIINEKGQEEEANGDYGEFDKSSYLFNVTAENIEKIKKLPNVTNVYMYNQNGIDLNMFPFDTTNYKNSTDSYGPIVVPAKGASITLSKNNMALYQRLISVYENHSLDIKGDKIFIDGKETNTYTFKFNYYWMMGDNRHRSQDSRYWGFVPETHIVGRASLIWFSWKKGPRWSRLFNLIK